MAMSKFESIWRLMERNKIQIAGKSNPEIICTLCNNIMINACNVPCGCRFCMTCLEKYLNGNEIYCPGNLKYCNDDVISYTKNVQVDQAINNKISILVVKCPLNSCDFQCKLNELEDHIRICGNKTIECPFFQLGCDVINIVTDNMKQHLLMDICKHTQLLIDWVDNSKNNFQSIQTNISEINQKMEFFHGDLQSIVNGNQIVNTNMAANEELIQEIDELKTNNNILTRQIDNFNEKIENIENKLIEILKKNVDMQSIINQQNLQISNLNKNLVDLRNGNIGDINLLEMMKKHEINKPKEDYNEVLMEETSENSEMSEENEDDNNETKEQLNILQKLLLIENNIDDIKQENENHQKIIINKIEEIENKNLELIEKTEITNQTLTIIEGKSNNCNNKLMKLELLLEQQNWGEFVWLIDNWNEKYTQARNNSKIIIYSRPFYSSKKGYKISLIIYPDGIGVGRNTYLSVFCCIMRGSYDDILQWPFEDCVSIELINQDNGDIHVKYSCYYEYGKNNINRDKPIDELNGGLGDYLFISHSELISNEGLIKNDQICIRCTVLKSD